MAIIGTSHVGAGLVLYLCLQTCSADLVNMKKKFELIRVGHIRLKGDTSKCLVVSDIPITEGNGEHDQCACLPTQDGNKLVWEKLIRVSDCDKANADIPMLLPATGTGEIKWHPEAQQDFTKTAYASILATSKCMWIIMGKKPDGKGGSVRGAPHLVSARCDMSNGAFKTFTMPDNGVGRIKFNRDNKCLTVASDGVNLDLADCGGSSEFILPSENPCRVNRNCTESMWCDYNDYGQHFEKWCLEQLPCPFPYCSNTAGGGPPLAIAPNSAPVAKNLQDMMPCPGTPAQTTRCMTESKYDEVAESVADMLRTLPSCCNTTYCPQADFAGCVLRMAGHDFMDFKDGKGGSDGCVEMDHAENRGLADCVTDLEHRGASLLKAYEQHCTDISLADFIVIAAESVMTESRKHITSPTFNFKSNFRYGRTTASQCIGSGDLLPDPERGCPAVEEVFLNRLGLDWDGATALMGVHTLGRAKPENSGYNGFWSDPANGRIFNNAFYQVLLMHAWLPDRGVMGNPKKNQWSRSGNGRLQGLGAREMMLNTDICLVYNDKGDLFGAGVELTADNYQCCAWQKKYEDFNLDNFRRQILRKSEENGVLHCGDPLFAWPYVLPPRGFPDATARAECCGPINEAFCDDNSCGRQGTNRWTRQKPQKKDGGHDCPEKGSGIEAARCYASNEQAWVDQFKHAWYLVTSNGFSDLKCLQGRCDAGNSSAGSCAPASPRWRDTKCGNSKKGYETYPSPVKTQRGPSSSVCHLPGSGSHDVHTSDVHTSDGPSSHFLPLRWAMALIVALRIALSMTS
eukprot:TRINITY_DN48701_c0_g1_i1.p1 TRINITY_DN48701_c0_g1~~TRINITY_DN48701_c0_g1_i1.p1  ORF type:complete len:799 (+),score=94.09 TRINITY_DN48701_c0_g1_i1:88-2484(+)